MVECQLPKLKVASSSLVARSKFQLAKLLLSKELIEGAYDNRNYVPAQAA